MSKAFQSGLLALVIFLAASASLFFFVDRVACLFQTPYKSAISGWDNSFYYYWLRSPVIDGDFDFRNDISYCKTLPPEQQERALHLSPTSEGYIPNKYGVGWAVSNLPFYFLTHLLAKAYAYATGDPIARDGYGAPYQLSIFISQLAWALFGLWSVYAILRTWFDSTTSLIAMLLTWLGSFLLIYQTSFVTMAHNVVFSTVAGVYWCTLRCEKNPLAWRWWCGLTLLGGLMLITRYQTGIYLLYPGVVVLSLLIKKPELWTRFLAATGIGLLIVGIQMAAWKILYGQWLLYSYEGETFNWGRPRLWDVLFSPFHGLFYWHPILLLGTLGFIAMGAVTRGRHRLWLIVFALLWYVNGAWGCWWFGASFGSRAFEACVIFCMIGVAFFFEKSKAHPLTHYLFTGVLLTLVFLNLSLSLAVRKNYFSLEEPVTHREMALAMWKMGGFQADRP